MRAGAGAGASVIWDGRSCTILVVSASQVTVRDGEGAEYEVERGAFESTVRRAVPVTRKLSSYLRDLDEGPVVGAWLVAVEAVLAAGPGERKATIAEQAAAGSYEVRWKVLNRGAEAERRDHIRGEIIRPTHGTERREVTSFRGNHYVECYVIQRNVVVARGHIDIPIAAESS